MSAFQKYFVETITERYADFSGRARRSEYWYFTLFTSLIVIALVILGFSSIDFEYGGIGTMGWVAIGLGSLFFITIFIPSIAVTVRRLHDIGQSGWLYLLGFIPYIGSFILLILCVMDSKPETNKWGPNPKAPADDSITDHLV